MHTDNWISSELCKEIIHDSLSQIQISAYLDNVFDVAALMEDSETKTAALERVAELEDELAHVSYNSYIAMWFTVVATVFCVVKSKPTCYDNYFCRLMMVFFN